jgi:DNA-binding MarR family transcriptional regulator
MSEVYEQLLDELNSQDVQEGFSSVDLLKLPPNLASLIGKMMRHNGMTLEELAVEVHQSPEAASKLVDKLMEKGYVRQIMREDKAVYKTKFTSKPRKSRPILQEQSFLDTLIENTERRRS